MNVIRPAVVLDLVRADVLRDAAGLGLDDRRLANRVEQARLAVVDVAHDRDHRGTQDEIRLRVLEDLGLLVFLGDVLDRHLALQLGGDQLDLLVGERLRGSPHLAEVHEDLDQLRHRDAQRLREVADRDAGLNGHRPGRGDDLAGLLRRADFLATAALAPGWAAAALAALVDDDPALAARARAAAGPDWSIGPICHVSES